MVLAGQDPDGGWHARLTESRVHVTPTISCSNRSSLDAETAEAIDQILTERLGIARRVRRETRT